MLVSLVMPVFNASRYLAESISSVLNQSYEEWELVCVDDGSTDESHAMLKAFAKRDGRIKVFSQNNSGAASARRRAIQEAKGSYIAYLDADDFLSKDFLEQTTSTALEYRADTVMPELMRVDADGVSGLGSMSKSFGLSPGQVITPRDAFVRTFPWTVHGFNLYRSDLLKKYACSSLADLNDFDSDEVITRYLLLFSDKIVVSSGRYFFRRNPNSTTQSFSLKKMSGLKSSQHLYDLALSNGFRSSDLSKVSAMALARSSFLKYEVLKNRRAIDDNTFEVLLKEISDDYLRLNWRRSLVLSHPKELFKVAFVRSSSFLLPVFYHAYNRLRRIIYSITII